MFDGYFQQQQCLLEQALKVKQCGTLLVLTEGGTRSEYFATAHADMMACITCRSSLGQYDIVSDFTALPFLPKHIDTAILWYLPSELVDWPALLAELNVLLADDGCLMIFNFHPWHSQHQIARMALLKEAGVFPIQKRQSILPMRLKQHLSAQQFDIVILRRFGLPGLTPSQLHKQTGIQLCFQSLMPWRYLGYLCIAQKKTLGMIVDSNQMWQYASAGMKKRAAMQPQNLR